MHKSQISGIIAFFMLVLSGVATYAEPGANLTGAWVLDENSSDDPGTVIREAGSAAGGRGNVLHGIIGSVSVFGIPVGNLPLPQGGSQESSESGDDALHAEFATSRVERIRVLQDEGGTELEYDGATLVSYRHGVGEELDDATVLAQWGRRGFVIEHALEDGTEITETYRLDTDADELYWTVRIKAKGSKKMEFTRVYDRVTAPGSRLTS